MLIWPGGFPVASSYSQGPAAGKLALVPCWAGRTTFWGPLGKFRHSATLYNCSRSPTHHGMKTLECEINTSSEFDIAVALGWFLQIKFCRN